MLSYAEGHGMCLQTEHSMRMSGTHAHKILEDVSVLCESVGVCTRWHPTDVTPERFWCQ